MRPRQFIGDNLGIDPATQVHPQFNIAQHAIRYRFMHRQFKILRRGHRPALGRLPDGCCAGGQRTFKQCLFFTRLQYTACGQVDDVIERCANGLIQTGILPQQSLPVP